MGSKEMGTPGSSPVCRDRTPVEKSDNASLLLDGCSEPL